MRLANRRSVGMLVIVVSAAGLGAAVGPGCGSSSSGGSSTASPAGTAFCTQYAQSLCHREFECTPAAQRDAIFNAFFGTSESQCTSILTKECTDPPPADQVPDVSCAGGKQVDAGAQASCIAQVAAVSCTDLLNNNFPNDCGKVCVAGPTGVGGAQGGGVGGAGGGPATSAPAFCQQSTSIECTAVFACVAPADRDIVFTTIFGTSVDDCKSTMTAGCDTVTCTPFNASYVQACLTALNARSCSDVLNNTVPPSCSQACGGQ